MTARTALRALRRNKLRSALTMLGVVIGVGAVIVMVSIGQGASAAVRAQIEALGTNLLMVIPGATTRAGVRSGWGGAAVASNPPAASTPPTSRSGRWSARPRSPKGASPGSCAATSARSWTRRATPARRP